MFLVKAAAEQPAGQTSRKIDNIDCTGWMQEKMDINLTFSLKKTISFRAWSKICQGKGDAWKSHFKTFIFIIN